MKFFTHELHKRFNSQDLEEAIRADEEWEHAIVEYKKHLGGFRDELPPGAKKLAEELNLHDTKVIAPVDGSLEFFLNFDPNCPGSSGSPIPIRSSLLLLATTSEQKVTFILYSLWQRPVWDRPRTTQPVFWLFDEFQRDPQRPGHFFHSILFSDGSTLQVPFVDCRTFELQAEEASRLNAGFSNVG